MATVKIKKETLNEVLKIVSNYPIAYTRYQQVNPLWINAEEGNEMLYDDAQCVTADIPGWDEDSDLSLSEAKWEYKTLEHEMGEPSYDAFLILDALTTTEERPLSGRSTPCLGSSNDYQRGRD